MTDLIFRKRKRDESVWTCTVPGSATEFTAEVRGFPNGAYGLSCYTFGRIVDYTEHERLAAAKARAASVFSTVEGASA